MLSDGPTYENMKKQLKSNGKKKPPKIKRRKHVATDKRSVPSKDQQG